MRRMPFLPNLHGSKIRVFLDSFFGVFNDLRDRTSETWDLARSDISHVQSRAIRRVRPHCNPTCETSNLARSDVSDVRFQIWHGSLSGGCRILSDVSDVSFQIWQHPTSFLYPSDKDPCQIGNRTSETSDLEKKWKNEKSLDTPSAGTLVWPLWRAPAPGRDCIYARHGVCICEIWLIHSASCAGTLTYKHAQVHAWRTHVRGKLGMDAKVTECTRAARQAPPLAARPVAGHFPQKSHYL